MENAAFFAPGAYDAEAEQVRRRQAYARALLDQSQSPEAAGEMVSGHYVPTFSGLKKIGQALMGRNYADAADKEMAALSDTRRAETQADLSKYAELLRGTPAGPRELAGPMEDGTAGYTVDAPAVAGDPMKAAEFLKGSRDPSLQQFGMQQMMTQAAQQAQLQQQEALRQKFNAVLAMEGMTPQKALQLGVPHDYVKNYYEAPNIGRAKVNIVEQNGQYVPISEYGDTPAGLKPVAKTGDPTKDLILGDGKGGFVPNAPLVGVKKEIGKASAPQVSVDARNFSTQENEQSKAYGKSLGDLRAEINQAGWNAPKQLANLDRMEALLKGIDGGGAAPTLAQVSSFANSLGIKLDTKLGPKEASIALARDMAGQLRKPGTGHMTDKDFDNFLAQIPDLSKSAEGRKQIMTTMRAAIQRDLNASQFARDYAKKNGGVIDDNFFDAMAGFYAQNPVVTPKMPATNAQGLPFSNSAIDDEIRKRRTIRGGR